MFSSMSFRRHLEQKINNEGVKLLCQIPISEEEYEFLLKEIRFKVDHLYLKNDPSDDIITSAALTQIAMRCYKEGNFWDYFNKALGYYIPSVKQSYLGKIFICTIRKYNLLEIIGMGNYVENIKAHTFVPDNYLCPFFDFAHDFEKLLHVNFLGKHQSDLIFRTTLYFLPKSAGTSPHRSVSHFRSLLG